MKNRIIAITLATIWISLSEVFRNSFLLHSHWIEHYQNLGQIFPEQPINGMVWGIWALVFATVMYFISQKFSFNASLILCWVIGFVMMWLVIGNLGVLPFSILLWAIPLSILEVYISLFILKFFTKTKG